MDLIGTRIVVFFTWTMNKTAQFQLKILYFKTEQDVAVTCIPSVINRRHFNPVTCGSEHANPKGGSILALLSHRQLKRRMYGIAFMPSLSVF